MKSENMKFFEKKIDLEKKSFGSSTDTEIVPRFRFSILKPGFGRTLPIRTGAAICFWTLIMLLNKISNLV